MDSVIHMMTRCLLGVESLCACSTGNLWIPVLKSRHVLIDRHLTVELLVTRLTMEDYDPMIRFIHVLNASAHSGQWS